MIVLLQMNLPKSGYAAWEDGLQNINTIRQELKKEMNGIFNKDINNINTGIVARVSTEGFNKMTSGKAIEKSNKNGFSTREHFEAVRKIVD